MGIALPSDLCSLSDVNSFLNLTPGNADESRLLTLINGLSEYLQQICSRDFALQYISEMRNGTGQMEMMVLNPPMNQLLAVYFLGTPMTLAPDDLSGGVVWDSERIMLRGGVSIVGASSFIPSVYIGRFPVGHRNIRINYLAGWQLPNQGTADWVTVTKYYPRTTILPTSNNAGGFIFEYQAKPSLIFKTSGASRPQFPQTAGATVVDGGVTWTNLGVKTMPDALPLSFQEACAEIVATRYRQQPRWADTGTGLGPERVNYFIKDMAESTKALIQNMRIVYPILP